jgi:hypothetical protein
LLLDLVMVKSLCRSLAHVQIRRLIWRCALDVACLFLELSRRGLLHATYGARNVLALGISSTTHLSLRSHRDALGLSATIQLNALYEFLVICTSRALPISNALNGMLHLEEVFNVTRRHLRWVAYLLGFCIPFIVRTRRVWLGHRLRDLRRVVLWAIGLLLIVWVRCIPSEETIWLGCLGKLLLLLRCDLPPSAVMACASVII